MEEVNKNTEINNTGKKSHISGGIKRTWCFNAVKRDEPDEYRISIYLKAIDSINAEKQFAAMFPDLEWKERYLKTRG